MQRRDWTIQEQKYLLENYGTVPNAAIESKLNRTKNSVQSKAVALGLIKNPKRRWTKEETNLIRELLGEKPVTEIHKDLTRLAKSKRLPPKSYQATVCYIRKLKLKIRVDLTGSVDWFTADAIASGLGTGTKPVYRWLKIPEYRKLLKPVGDGKGSNQIAIKRNNLKRLLKSF